MDISFNFILRPCVPGIHDEWGLREEMTEMDKKSFGFICVDLINQHIVVYAPGDLYVAAFLCKFVRNISFSHKQC